MDCTAQRIPYRQTGKFSKIVLDYIDQSAPLQPFFTHAPTLQGIQGAIEQRQLHATDRALLVVELKKQYTPLVANELVLANIESLLSTNTFTICTAHQPNLFTGPLFFIYKILHTIRLADHLNSSLNQYKFIPVFYMGSEDADLDELGHFYLNGQKSSWDAGQVGAVGRMKVNKELLKLIDAAEGQLMVQPFGKEIMDIVRECYAIGEEIQVATFKLVNTLFGEFGLIVLLPDNVALKKQMSAVFEEDLLRQASSAIVEKTSQQLDKLYKVQAHPREINLFYLKGNIRERIVRSNSGYVVHGTNIHFSEDELKAELAAHPDRFSPNVILRGLYQETILPNIVFIGGGGELAYWLELKDLFTHYKVPFPLLLLRNSFLFVEKKWIEKIDRLQFKVEDFFQPEEELVNTLVIRESSQELKLNGTLSQTGLLYDAIRKQASSIDITLEKHVEALKIRTIQRLQELEKKMLRAEKRKFAEQQRQIHTIKEVLFPKNGLQERNDNIMYYYAKWGRDFINKVYEYSLSLEQEFVVLSEK